MFRSHSDHLQGARVFLIEVTDFKILKLQFHPGPA